MKINKFVDKRYFDNLIDIFRRIDKGKIYRFRKNDKSRNVKSISYKKRIFEKTTYLNINYLENINCSSKSCSIDNLIFRSNLI